MTVRRIWGEETEGHPDKFWDGKEWPPKEWRGLVSNWIREDLARCGEEGWQERFAYTFGTETGNAA